MLVENNDGSMPENVRDEALKQGWNIERAQRIHDIVVEGAASLKDQGLLVSSSGCALAIKHWCSLSIDPSTAGCARASLPHTCR